MESRIVGVLTDWSNFMEHGDFRIRGKFVTTPPISALYVRGEYVITSPVKRIWSENGLVYCQTQNSVYVLALSY